VRTQYQVSVIPLSYLPPLTCRSPELGHNSGFLSSSSLLLPQCHTAAIFNGRGQYGICQACWFPVCGSQWVPLG
jgi:hypothetical protein